MEKISLILVDYEKFLKPIIQSVIKDIEKLTGNSAQDEGILSKDILTLMERLAKHSPSGRNACLNQIFELLFKEGSTTRIAKSVFAIRNESQLTDLLFNFISQNIDQLPQQRMPDIYTSIYRATHGESGTSLSKLLMKHLLEVKDKIRSEDLVKFCLLLLGNENGVYDSAFDLLKNNPKLGMHDILLASGTKNSRQSERLSQLISLLIKQPDSDSVDPSLMVRSLLAASTPELSAELYKLMVKFNPTYRKMLRKKEFIRDLKYLAQNSSGAQQATAKKMLDEERGRGLAGRFNVWQWKPSIKYEISVGEDIWWSREPEFISA